MATPILFDFFDRPSPHTITLSPEMQRRIAAGQVDEAVVYDKTAGWIAGLVQLADDMEQKPNQLNKIGQRLLDWAREHSEQIDWNAVYQQQSVVEWISDIRMYDPADELDGILYADDKEKRKDQWIKKTDKWLTPSRWLEESQKPWHKILLETALEQGANPQQTGSAPAHLPAYQALLSMRQGCLETLLSHGARLQENGEAASKDWQLYRTSIHTDEQADSERVKGFEACVKGWFERARQCQQQVESGALQVDELNRSDVCLLSMLNRHHAVFEPQRWQGKEMQALLLMDQLPPFMQQELVQEQRQLMQMQEPDNAIAEARHEGLAASLAARGRG